MKKRAGKAALLVFEIVAILGAVIAAGLGFAYWRVQQGPVSIAAFRPSLELAVERRLPEGYDAKIGEIVLERREGEFALGLGDLEIFDNKGDPAAAAAEANLRFGLETLLNGQIGPRLVDIKGAAFYVVRNENQNLKVPVAQARSRRSLFRSSAGMVENRIMQSALETATMRDARIVFFDEASGRSWTSRNASVEIVRTLSGLKATVFGNIDLDGAGAFFHADADFNEASGEIDLDVAGENFPIGDILSMFYGERARVVDAPVSGSANLKVATDGDIKTSVINAMIEKGVLTLAGNPVPIEKIEWRAEFNPETDRFAIEEFRYDVAENRGVISGAVWLTFGENLRDPRQVNFDLTASDVVLALPARLPAPLSVGKSEFKGRYDIAERALSFDTLMAEAVGVRAAGELALIAPRRDGDSRLSPGVTAELTIDGSLDPERLLKVWPLGLAMGARDWIEDRLDAAVITDIEVAANLAPGAIGPDGKMPDEALDIRFSITDAKAIYVNQMPPLTGASGSGVLRGNSFCLTADRARVGDISITKGELHFPEFIPKWQDTFIRFTADGRSKEMLSILDREPLLLLSKINLEPGQFAGDARAEIEIIRPNKRDALPEEYRYSGLAKFENMQVSGLAGEASLENASGTVTLKPRSLRVDGEALLADAPVDIVWLQNFYTEDGPSEFNFASTLDSSIADLFGLSLRQYVRGPVAVNVKALGSIGSFDSATMTADFAAAGLSLDLLGWRKPAGAPTTARVALEFGQDAVNATEFLLNGEGVSIAGSMRLENGGLQSATFSNFQLSGAADLALLMARKPQGALEITATGPYLNVGPAVEKSLGSTSEREQGASGIWGPGIDVTARVDMLEMRNAVRYQDASLDLWRDSDRLQALDFSALNDNGRPLKVTLSQLAGDEGPTRRIEARSSNLGRFLNGLVGWKSLGGGEGSMDMEFGDPLAPGVTGRIEARGMQVVDAPLLARLFSAGSLEGLSDLMSGEGIDLSYAYGEFKLAENALNLKNFRATGPSVGLTAAGEIGLGDQKEIALSGAIAPLYQLNSVLGAAPIIGDILVGKKGEGVFALSYNISGNRQQPAVFVNPLSALTPGIFRQLFEAERRPISPASDGEVIPADVSDAADPENTAASQSE